MFELSWAKKAAYLYLGLPVLIFFFGWLNFVPALIFSALFVMVLIRNRQNNIELFSFRRTDIVLSSFIILIWIFLSGIGGYSFQNWDHHSRNALFHDLIDYPWPVVYDLPEQTAVEFSVSPNFLLSYYFGFWLPAALVGKLLGWGAANFFLFLWSFIGLALSVVLTSTKIRLSLIKTSLLLIFFSGMDILGSLLFQNLPLYDYPKSFPPIQHLEWWAGTFGFLQYSSFTTDLFWTYNQFIPALLVLSLFVTASNTRSHIFLIGLCFFFAPLPALGLSLYAAVAWIRDFFSNWKKETRAALRLILTLENITGFFVAGISLLFFSTNFASEERSVGLPAPVLLFIIFTLFEWLVLWVFLLPANKKDWTWYLIGMVLLIFPFINFGGSWDFMMRATIPSFYLLMIGCGVYLSSDLSLQKKLPVLIVLIVGSVTALYEMNRSLARFAYYSEIPIPDSLTQYFENPPTFDLRFVPEFDHPDTLVADEWKSISIPNNEGWVTKAGELFPSSYHFLWREELQQK